MRSLALIMFLASVSSAATTSSTRPAVERAASSLNEAGYATIAGEFLVRFIAEPGDLSDRGVKIATQIGERIFRVEFQQELTLEEAQARLEGLTDLVEPNVAVVQAVSGPEFERFAVVSVPTPSGQPLAYLTAINIAPLLAAQPVQTKKILVVVADSGINASSSLAGKVSATMSRSCVDSTPLFDADGHGTTIAHEIDSIAPKGVEFVSLKILLPNGRGGTYGTLDCLVWAISVVGSWNRPAIVNFSLQGYPVSQIVRDAMEKLQDRVFFGLIAGNFGVNPVSFPGYYAAELPNALCVASAEMSGQKSPYSNWGPRAEIAGFGTLSSSLRGTSFASPQAVGVAALFQQLGDFSPGLLKKVILAGGRYDPSLAGLIGDPIRQLDGLKLDGGGVAQTLGRLHKIRLLAPLFAQPGEEVRVATSEDSGWLARFSPQFKLTDQSGNTRVVSGKLAGSQLFFSVPIDGIFKIRLTIDGTAFGDEPTLVIQYRRRADINQGRGRGLKWKYLIPAQSLNKPTDKQ